MVFEFWEFVEFDGVILLFIFGIDVVLGEVIGEDGGCGGEVLWFGIVGKK